MRVATPSTTQAKLSQPEVGLAPAQTLVPARVVLAVSADIQTFRPVVSAAEMSLTSALTDAIMPREAKDAAPQTAMPAPSAMAALAETAGAAWILGLTSTTEVMVVEGVREGVSGWVAIVLKSRTFR